MKSARCAHPRHQITKGRGSGVAAEALLLLLLVSGGKEGSPGNPKCVFIKYALRALSVLRAARIETRFGVSSPAAPALDPTDGEMGRGMCRNPDSELRLSPPSACGLPRSLYVAQQRP
ncbi:hypothetical protein NDU88_005453 [Pleurodeles waltl]|uniref:Secreted protein n=1 Tax=Pleurodeles waltl TaxID=8319 RepID=A0AAV7QI61_PLEWA|nr:hypothetical protein NDU88_005453 [Pleurodeles waltl]